MSDTEQDVRARLNWVNLYEQTQDAGLTCLRCGISRPTLRKPRVPEQPLRYSRPVPKDRVQMDTCQVGPRLYPFTAVDDCTRLRVLGVYSARTAAHAMDFLVERMLDEFPFPIQRIQTDRGSEFFGVAFQQALREHCIKFRPNRPGAPRLNGKVERSQQTDKIEFWATADLSSPDLPLRLSEWQHYYNWMRPHTSLKGVTPMHYFFSLVEKTPWSEEVEQQYDLAQEPFRDSNYQLDKQMKTLMKQRTKTPNKADEH